MKPLIVAALIGGQIATAQPALAADLAAAQPERVGAFGGMRVRVPLGGDPQQRRVRAGLAIAPTLLRDGVQGERTLRIGEGVELGYRSGRPLALSVGGLDIGDPRLGAAQEGPEEEEEERGGKGTTGWLITGGLIILVIGGALYGINEWAESLGE